MGQRAGRSCSNAPAKPPQPLGEFSCRLAADMTMHRHLHNLKSRSTALTCGLPGLPEPVGGPRNRAHRRGFPYRCTIPEGVTVDPRPTKAYFSHAPFRSGGLCLKKPGPTGCSSGPRASRDGVRALASADLCERTVEKLICRRFAGWRSMAGAIP